jgi:hypothetical protein
MLLMVAFVRHTYDLALPCFESLGQTLTYCDEKCLSSHLFRCFKMHIMNGIRFRLSLSIMLVWLPCHGFIYVYIQEREREIIV